MLPLPQDLQKPKVSLNEFENITVRVLEYLPNVLSGFKDKGDYPIHLSTVAGTTKYIRPINKNLFIYSSIDFKNMMNDFRKLIGKMKVKTHDWSDYEKNLIDSVFYTIQQSIGAGFDLLSNPNSARKHVGNRFEELIKCIFSEIGIANKRTVLQIPYETDEGEKLTSAKMI